MSNETEHVLAHAIGHLSREISNLGQIVNNHAVLTRLDRIERLLIMNQAELAAGLTRIQTQVGKVATEQANRFDSLTAKIADLEALIAAGGTVTEEVTTALAGVQTALQALDDVIPDAPEPPVA